jgi:hypothetical protein
MAARCPINRDVNGKVLHLGCVEYRKGNIYEPHGPLATDNVVREGGRITLWRAGCGYDWTVGGVW